MSTPSDSAASPARCACTNISLMQLFHELKQKFPGVPDHVVSNTIELYCHDKQACETHLHREVKASLTHAYHASSLAAARKLNELKINYPGKCRNQPIIKHDAPKINEVKSIQCQGPQSAVLSSNFLIEENDSKRDANQNAEDHQSMTTSTITSPVAVINIDNCVAKYSASTPSDFELSNESIKDIRSPQKENIAPQQQDQVSEQPGSTNFRLLKSNKIRCNLHERLEKGKEKKTIKKEHINVTFPPDSKAEPVPDRPKRPNTLEFAKPNPDIAFRQTLKEPVNESCRTISPVPNAQKEELNDTTPGGSYRQLPLNLSVNVNCHMDLPRNYDPWLHNFDSPRAITSVNLTVCTPTSNMASPVRETKDSREEDSGFEGHVTVTVSPSTARAPRRKAPPPPPQAAFLETSRPSRLAPEPPEQTNDLSLIERQRARLGRLKQAMDQERSRRTQLLRETRVLSAPPPSPLTAQRLRDQVDALREQCRRLSKRLELATAEREGECSMFGEERGPASWQCHMCTFRNHPLLDKCEECDMPRILVVRSPDGITVRLMPGRRKIVRSWVL